MRATISIPAALAHGDGEAMPATPDPMSVPDAIYHTVHGYPGGVSALAARMGLPVPTLTHKANPNNDTHFLRPQELVTLQHMSGDAAVLMAMAAALGYTVTRATPDQTGGDPLQALVRLQVEMADLVRAAAEPLERLVAKPGECTTSNELRRVQYHAEETSAALSHLVGALRARQRVAPKVDY